MGSGDDFDIAHARQTYRALRLVRMPEPPAYATCVAVACRVGRAISAHAAGMWNTAIQLSAEQAIRTAHLDTALGLPFLPEQSLLPLPKYPPSDTEKFFAQALKAFRFAAESTEIIDTDTRRKDGKANE